MNDLYDFEAFASKINEVETLLNLLKKLKKEEPNLAAVDEVIAHLEAKQKQLISQYNFACDAAIEETEILAGIDRGDDQDYIKEEEGYF